MDVRATGLADLSALRWPRAFSVTLLRCKTCEQAQPRCESWGPFRDVRTKVTKYQCRHRFFVRLRRARSKVRGEDRRKEVVKADAYCECCEQPVRRGVSVNLVRTEMGRQHVRELRAFLGRESPPQTKFVDDEVPLFGGGADST